MNISNRPWSHHLFSRQLLILLSLTIFWPHICFSEVEVDRRFDEPVTVPDALVDWVGWIKDADHTYYCTKNSKGVPTCEWPETLNLEVGENTIRFSQVWNLQERDNKKSSIPLIGASRIAWPFDVKVNGQEVPVLKIDDRPVIFLSDVGKVTVTGTLKIPVDSPSVPVPVAVGLTSAVDVSGVSIKPISVSALRNGNFWIRETRDSAATEKKVKPQDAVSLDVYRKINDAIPTTVESLYKIRISGTPRKIQIPANLSDTVVTKIQSSVPARIIDDMLYLQVNPGQAVVRVTSRFDTTISSFTFPDFKKSYAFWPKSEYWSFKTTPSLRQVDFKSELQPLTTSVSPIPKEWRNLMSYQLMAGDSIQLKELQRGFHLSSKNSLEILRNLYIDESLDFITYKENLSGEFHDGWRLDVHDQAEIGSITQNLKPQLITSYKGQKGIEVRSDRIQIQATGLLKSLKDIPVSGWKTPVEKVKMQIGLPIGTTIFAAPGTESYRNTWVGSWDLYRIFLFLLIVVLMLRVLSPAAALATFLLFGIDRFAWPLWGFFAALIIVVVINRHFPTNRKLRYFQQGMCVLVCAACLSPIVNRIKYTVYPQLSSSARTMSFVSPVVKKNPIQEKRKIQKSVMPTEGEGVINDAETFEQRSPSVNMSRGYGKGAIGSRPASPVSPPQRIQKYQQRQNLQIQTGPGVPERVWSQTNFYWNSPVADNDTFSLYLIPFMANRLFAAIQAACILWLLYMFGSTAFPRKTLEELKSKTEKFFEESQERSVKSQPDDSEEDVFFEVEETSGDGDETGDKESSEEKEKVVPAKKSLLSRFRRTSVLVFATAVVLSMSSQAEAVEQKASLLPPQNLDAVSANQQQTGSAVSDISSTERSDGTSSLELKTNHSFPPEYLLRDLHSLINSPPRPAECSPNCLNINSVEFQAVNDSLSLIFSVSVLDDTTLVLPQTSGRWQPEQITIDGLETAQIRKNDKGRLEVLLRHSEEHQIQTVRLVGKPLNDTETFSFKRIPERVTVQPADDMEYAVSGLTGETLTSNSLTLQRLKSGTTEDKNNTAAEENETGLVSNIENFPGFVRVHRTLFFGENTSVHTNVQLLSSSQNPIRIRVPLLKGEKLLTTALNMKRHKSEDQSIETIAVELSNSRRHAHWSSTLPKSEDGTPIELKATTLAGIFEKWSVSFDHLYHLETGGLRPTSVSKSGRSLSSWTPRPGESVQLALTELAGISGKSLTINNVEILSKIGKSSEDVTVKFRIQVSQGNLFSFIIPDGYLLQELLLDRKKLPLPTVGEDRKIQVTLSPAARALQMSLTRTNLKSAIYKTPEIRIEDDPRIANVTLSTEIFDGRWILGLSGPRISPVVIIWSELLILLVFAIGFSKFNSPLRLYSWILLFLGFMHIGYGQLFIVSSWFLLFNFRHSSAKWFATAAKKKYLQVGLVILSLLFVVCLFEAVRTGLLGSPKMTIVGNNSSSYKQFWYQSGLPLHEVQATVYSIPMIVYQGLMLAWSVWLVISLGRWFKWAWAGFLKDGVWPDTAASRIEKQAVQRSEELSADKPETDSGSV